VTEALIEHYRPGISTFLIRGFDLLEDAPGYGRDLLPLVHAAVASENSKTHAKERETAQA
jgi:alkanesulfonate monooxygenase